MAFSMYINIVDLPFLWNWVEWSVWLDVVSMLSVVLFGFAVIPDDASMMSIIKLPEAIFEDSFGHRKLSILVIDIFGFEMAKLIYAICFIASFHNIILDKLWAFTKDGQLLNLTIQCEHLGNIMVINFEADVRKKISM